MIILLAAVCVFLAVMLILGTSSEKYDSTSIENIKELLNSSCINASDKFFNLENENSKIYSCEFSPDYPKKVAEIILGEYVEAFSTPNGAEFFLENAFLKITEDFELEYKTDGFDPQIIETGTLQDDTDKIIPDFFKPTDDYGIDVVKCTKDNDVIYAELIQTVGESPIMNHRIKLWLNEDGIMALCGKWCFLPIEESFSAQPLDSVNILFIEKGNFEKEKNENAELHTELTVKDMKSCLLSRTNLEGSKMYIIPSWQISWEEAVPDCFYNAVTGEKTTFESPNVN